MDEATLAKQKVIINSKYQNVVLKSVFVICLILLIIIGGIISLFQSFFIVPNTIENIVSDCFENEQIPHPVENMLDYGNGFIIIRVRGNDKIIAMNNMRTTYYKLSKKISTKKIDKMAIVVYSQDEHGYSQTILSSNVWIKDLKSTDWSSITKYDDFRVKANITNEK